MNNLSRYQGDLDNLVQLGHVMLDNIKSPSTDKPKEARYQGWIDVPTGNAGDPEVLNDEPRDTAPWVHPESGESIIAHYQDWYTESRELIKQLLPSRQEEFEELYKGNKPGRIFDATHFGIQHWLLGMKVQNGALVPKGDTEEHGETELATEKLQTQLGILNSIKRRFQSSLFDMRQMVQADVFDSELDAADNLAKNGFTRAAGSLAGVVLEKHLGQVANNHSVTIKKNNPTISDFNDALKDNGTLDIPAWRQIQRLGDIRNLCSHDKGREPTKDDVSELIAGIEKFTKTLF